MLGHGVIPCGFEVQAIAIACTILALARPYLSLAWAAMRGWIHR
jgi:hypothetical protein